MSLDVRLINGGCEVFTYNITHNLAPMAEAVDLYEVLWQPEEMVPPIRKARKLRTMLRKGLKKLLADPASYKRLNPRSGWGDYDELVRFVRAYLEACRDNPNSEIHTSR